MSMSGFPSNVFVRAFNHLLAMEPWASTRLAHFSGNVALIIAPPVELSFSISPRGMLEVVGDQELIPSVTISLPQDALAKSITGGFSSTLASAKISGLADLADTLSFVFKNIRWDVEADLSSVIGDITAQRGMKAIRKGISWQQTSSVNILANVREYLVDESRQVVSQHEVHSFSASVTELRDEFARLEARVARL